MVCRGLGRPGTRQGRLKFTARLGIESRERDRRRRWATRATRCRSPSFGAPSCGALSGTAPALVYEPCADFSGTDLFSVRAPGLPTKPARRSPATWWPTVSLVVRGPRQTRRRGRTPARRGRGGPGACRGCRRRRDGPCRPRTTRVTARSPGRASSRRPQSGAGRSSRGARATASGAVVLTAASRRQSRAFVSHAHAASNAGAAARIRHNGGQTLPP